MPVPIIPTAVRDRLTLVLFLGQSLFSAAMIASFTLTAVIAADLSQSNIAAGLPNTLTLLGRAIAAYPIGLLLDKAGRRLGLSAGFGLGMLGCLVTVWAISQGSFLWFCIGATLLGTGRAANEQSRYVAGEIHTADRRAKVMGLMVFAGTLGAIGGPALVPWSQTVAQRMDMIDSSGPFLASIILFAVGLGLTMLFLRPDPKQIALQLESAEPNSDSSESRPLAAILKQPLIIVAIATMTVAQLVMVMVMLITPLHMDHHHHGSSAISFVISAHTFGMFALSGVTGWLIDRYGRMPLILVGAGVLIVACILAPLSTAVELLTVSLFLLGLGWNFCYIAGSSLLSDSLVTSERSRIQGISEIFVAVSASLAGLSSGFLFDWQGMTAISFAGAAFSLLLLLGLIYYTISQMQASKTAVTPKP